ncbi:hypothetical protein AALP_AAs40938U000200 [Arabis alpina]|uniref:Uncharacterized protein n=1 Tax=Arabis alpina TaxID=50452 RepID=A0A087G3W3_ARAAL|nr:hypothetical protein AALP_AAs40938U000200 [Arabis alpina]
MKLITGNSSSSGSDLLPPKHQQAYCPCDFNFRDLE